MFLICAMICLVTTFFALHHMWLLSTGTTTNESFKWADIKEAIETGEIVVLDQDDPYMYPPQSSPSLTVLGLIERHGSSR